LVGFWGQVVLRGNLHLIHADARQASVYASDGPLEHSVCASDWPLEHSETLYNILRHSRTYCNTLSVKCH